MQVAVTIVDHCRVHIVKTKLYETDKDLRKFVEEYDEEPFPFNEFLEDMDENEDEEFEGYGMIQSDDKKSYSFYNEDIDVHFVIVESN